jgi:hypothetical protein
VSLKSESNSFYPVVECTMLVFEKRTEYAQSRGVKAQESGNFRVHFLFKVPNESSKNQQVRGSKNTVNFCFLCAKQTSTV